jgi:hypothetical protein
MNTQKRERSRLAVFLPEPVVTSGKSTPQGIVSDGIIDWDFALHMWVQPMSSDAGRVYAPCVVFLDNTWVMIGPVGTLDAARQLCHRWSALHDRPVCDKTREPAPLPISPEGNLIDIDASAIDFPIPDHAWNFDEATRRFSLNLTVLGVEIGTDAFNICGAFEQKIAAVKETVLKVERALNASGCVQPHLLRAHTAKICEAAVFWLTELQATEDDEVETPEDTARSFVDDIRKGGITFADAYESLNRHIAYLYENARCDDGSPFAEAGAHAKRAHDAGLARLLHFFNQASPQ